MGGFPTNNKLAAEVGLKTVLDLWKNDVLLSLNCHAIATVTSFDPDFQTVQARMNYTQTINGVAVPYPPIIDCPIVMLSGGNAGLTFPIAAGDQCLILFNDRDFDLWYQGNSGTPPDSNRLHSFSDAVALIGLRSEATAYGDYDSTRARLFNGTSQVAVGPNLIKFETGLASLKVTLDNLVTALTTCFTTMATATPPTVVATVATPAAAAVTALTAVSTMIGELLE